MYPPSYQLQSQRVQAAYRYGDISFYHCIIDHMFWKVLFSHSGGVNTNMIGRPRWGSFDRVHPRVCGEHTKNP